MNKVILGAVVCVVVAIGLIGATVAQASIPSWGDRVDAKRFARAYWADDYGAYTDCSGVRMRWRNYHEDGYVRRAVAYQHGCTLTFNKRIKWGRIPDHGRGDDWWRFCVTAIHEYGHLPGMPYDGLHGPVHTHNPNHVMAVAESLSRQAWWWPFHPACRYQEDDLDGDDVPDYRVRV
jgi:hypothetical protein